MRQETVEQLGNAVTEDAWQTLSAGDASKGPRWHDWARVPLLSWQMPGDLWLLLRKSRFDGKPAYYVCYVPPGTDMQTMVQVACMRWMAEECFEAAKGKVGLDHYEVRSWQGWYRHITLAMLAHAFLAAVCTSVSEIEPFKKDTGPNGKVEAPPAACIALTVPEIRELQCRLVWRYLPDVRIVIPWSPGSVIGCTERLLHDFLQL